MIKARLFNFSLTAASVATSDSAGMILNAKLLSHIG